MKKSQDDGYVVGSRGSVGSSLVAFLWELRKLIPCHPIITVRTVIL